MPSRINIGPDTGPFVELDEENGEFVIRVPEDEVNFDQSDLRNVKDFTAESVSAEEADIIRRDEFETGYARSIGSIADTDTYDAEPYSVVADNGDLLTFYREATSHTDGGKVVYRRSTDFGATYGDPVTVVDEFRDDRNGPVYKTDTGRILLWYWSRNGDFEGTFIVWSDDNGQTWSDPVRVDDQLDNSRVPFGRVYEVGDELRTLFYTGSDGGIVETLSSTDDGETWVDQVTVANTEADGDREVTEPTPLVIDEDRQIIYGRDNNGHDGEFFFAVTSDDAGQTWSDPEYFNLANNQVRTPLYADKINETTAIVLIPRRGNGDNSLQYVTASMGRLWDDPLNLVSQEPRKIVDAEATASPLDFGYPTITKLGPGLENILVNWYDEEDEPNIYTGTLPQVSPELIVDSGREWIDAEDPPEDNTWATVESVRVGVEFEKSFSETPSLTVTAVDSLGFRGFASYSDLDETGFELVFYFYNGDTTGTTNKQISWQAVGR